MSLSLPYNLTNGQTADANQVDANFNAIVNFINGGGLATAGANFNITSLGGLTTPLSISQGGTGATTGAGARVLLGAAAAGANADITSLAALSTALSIAQGGTGQTTAAAAINALLPAQAGKSGQALMTNGAAASWGSTPIAQFQNRQTSGTASGEVLSNAAWTQRVLNTAVFNNIAGVSLVSNQLNLPAGTYEVWASAQAVLASGDTVFNHRLRVRDITDSATLITGQNNAAVSSAGADLALTAELIGAFSIASTKVVEVDSYTDGTGSTTGGTATSTGEAEVYVSIYLRKIG